MEECAIAFSEDKDIHPVSLVDSMSCDGNLSDATTVAAEDSVPEERPRHKRRLARQRQEELLAERYEEKREWRNELLNTLKDLVAKMPDNN